MRRTLFAMLTISTIMAYSCSESHFSPAERTQDASQQPGSPQLPESVKTPDAKPKSDSTSASQQQTSSSTDQKTPVEKMLVPPLSVDDATLQNDLVDPSVRPYVTGFVENSPVLATMIRAELNVKGIRPLNDFDFRMHHPAKVALGQLLFHDRILSGNKTVSCASCHVASRGTSDATSLTNDIGVKGLFAHIDQPRLQNFLPRNTPPLFNRGHVSFTSLFWDGRVEITPYGLHTPDDKDLPPGLESVVAAQSLFPLTAREEMLGDPADNSIAANLKSSKNIWAALASRVASNPQYLQMLQQAYPGVPDQSFGIQHIANALAAYEDQIFRADDSAFDRFLKGDNSSMTKNALLGAKIFYGKARCSSCHSGTLQTDNEFHSIAVPQFGIGKGHGIAGREDFGRGGITGRFSDRYKFRTPSLRNVYITGPWGHDGAFASLTEFVEHYNNPAKSLATWNSNQIILHAKQSPAGLFDPVADEQTRCNILAANEFPGVRLSREDIEWIVEFLGALTDRSYLTRGVTPTSVPSGMNDFLGVFSLRSDWLELLRPVPEL